MGSVSVYVKVWGAQHGYELKPTFYAWMDQNPSSEEKSAVPPVVKVSAAPSYNVKLAKVSDVYCSTQASFDFGAAGANIINSDKGVVEGQLSCYAVILQLYGDASKGLRGIEYPQGSISVDVTFNASFEYTDSNMEHHVIESLPTDCLPLVWSAEGNSAQASDPVIRSVRDYTPNIAAAGAGPYNSSGLSGMENLGTQGSQYCYQGGTWEVEQFSDRHVTLKVEDYTINPRYFPNANSRETTLTGSYYNKQQGVESCWRACFSCAKLFVVMRTSLIIIISFWQRRAS